MSNSKLIFVYWGKAKPVDANGASYHLLVYHSLDVAAVGVAYLRQSPMLLRTFCESFKCSEEAFLSFVAFLLALHDLGKFSEAFQSQRADLVFELQGHEPNATKIYSERHDSLGFWLWNGCLVEEEEILEIVGVPNNSKTQRAWRSLIGAVTGHHGMPPKPQGEANKFFTNEDKENALAFVKEAAELLLTEEAKQIITASPELESTTSLLSWWFAGVGVLADWLGSNTQFFKYKSEPEPLARYWEDIAKKQAAVALRHSGVLPVKIEAGKQLTDFFAHITEPSPLQRWASEVAMPLSPQIYLLEDVTGAGKTEAALMLAYRLMAKGSACGFFIGLPTMATANAMYARVALVYQKLFEGPANLALANGFKNLVEEFAKSVLPTDIPEGDAEQKDETATARCTAWLADHNKRALLASAGVGTIDQALLAVLHSKHQSLRLLGLFNKVLIVDEVHACDAYMQGILKVLLEFHARSGGSVILLSATLTNQMKSELLQAYAAGRNQNNVLAPAASAYPLATAWYEGVMQPQEYALASRANVSRTVQVHYETNEENVFSHVLAALKRGECVCWIRNTVSDAMAAYRRFAESVPKEKITLFHAKFAVQDRLNKEQLVLINFGDKSTSIDRSGQLLIATQVVEQSLDVDFDVLITDLAPIDRVLQRAGRLQRHVRDALGNRLTGEGVCDGRAPPVLWVFAPVWTTEPKADWYGAVFKKGQYVYQHHGQLWLTAKVLQNKQFTMPADARELIESVFSETASLPTALSKNAERADGKEMADASTAQQNTLKIGNGYKRGDVGDWWSDAKTPSRLGEETNEVMLAKWVGGRLQQWADGAWAYSMVKVAARLINVVDEPLDPQLQTAYKSLKQTLPSEGKWCVLLALSQRADGMWEGQALMSGNEKNSKSAESRTWLYDADFGLRMRETSADETSPAN